MTVITRTITIYSIICPCCGTAFGLSDDYWNSRVEDRKSFFCPNGHSQYFSGRNLKEELAIAQRDNEALRVQRRSLEKEVLDQVDKNKKLRAAKTRLRTRADAGVCTRCNRSFANVRRHMASQHPKK